MAVIVVLLNALGKLTFLVYCCIMIVNLVFLRSVSI